MAYNKKYYENHKQEVMSRRDRRRRERFAYVQRYKAGKGCRECGETDPVCLDLHHSDRSVKIAGVSRIIADGWSMERTLEELAKCDVLCANCHRKAHREDFTL